jgi:ribokinase
MQFEISRDTVLYAAEMAARLGVPILLNPAPSYPFADELLQKISYLILNEHEAELTSGLKVDDPAAAEAAARSLVSRGVKVVIITLGGQGLVMVNASQTWTLPAYQVPVVDSTAAGDAFIGAFAVALLEHGDLERAARFANAAGALTVTRLGAQTSIPTRDEVSGFLQG